MCIIREDRDRYIERMRDNVRDSVGSQYIHIVNAYFIFCGFHPTVFLKEYGN
jgi:hypothetical protein